MSINIIDVVDETESAFDSELEDNTPKIDLKITDVSGISPFDDRAQAARDEVEAEPETGIVAPAALIGLAAGYLSYSQIDLYTQCPLAYYKRYHEHKKPKKHPAARLGTTVHKVLERIYRWALHENYKGKFPMDKAFEILRDVWRHPTDGLAGEPHEWWADAVSMIRNYAQAVPQINASEVLGVELGEEDDETPVEGEDVTEEDVEEKRPTPFELGGFPFVAKIDRVERIDRESILITDYKSDRQIRYREEVDRDLQLTIYEITARKRFPWVKRVVLELFMLRHGIAQRPKERTPEDLYDAEMFVAETGRAIIKETEWAPKLNRWCHTCGFKLECSAYKDALDGSNASEEAQLIRDLVQIGARRTDELADTRDQFDHREKILKKRKDEIDKSLKATIELIPGNALITSSREYYVGVTTRKEYPRGDTARVAASVLGIPSAVIDAKIAAVDKALLDSALEKLGRGRTLGQVFDFEGPGATRVVPSAQLKMLSLELETIAKLSPSTRIMSRNRKSSDARKIAAVAKEEAAKTATLPAKLVDQAAATSRTAFAIKGEPSRIAEVEIPPPAKPDEIETVADVIRLWGAPKWAELEAGGEKPTTREPSFDGVEEDWLEPTTIIALWRAGAERIAPAAYVRKGEIRRPPPLAAAGEPATKVAEPATSVVVRDTVPAEAPAKKKRKPMSEETRAKLSAKQQERWAREKAKKGES